MRCRLRSVDYDLLGKYGEQLKDFNVEIVSEKEVYITIKTIEELNELSKICCFIGEKSVIFTTKEVPEIWIYDGYFE